MTENISPSPEDLFAPLRQRLQKALVGFSAEVPERTWSAEVSHRPDRGDFPVPELVLFALRNVLGFPWTGPEEKVRWSVHCLFTGVPVLLELRKFGFTICYPQDATVDVARLCGQLRTAVKFAEQWLQPFAQEQVEAGAVTIANRHSQFERRYRFFREHADAAYQQAAKPPDKVAADGQEGLAVFDGLAKSWNHMVRNRTEGFFYSTAMIDAFFSRIEHQFVLLLAFRGRPLANRALKAFLGSSWDEKLKTLIDVDADKDAQKAYARLKQLKERIRNPFAHGGVENDGGSLFVHVPFVGALPANFTQYRNSVQFNFIPVEEDDHRSACDTFDLLDETLRSGQLAVAQSFVEAGIDPSFDPESLATYARIGTAPAAERQEYFDGWHYNNDRHSNMDY